MTLWWILKVEEGAKEKKKAWNGYISMKTEERY